MSDREKQLEKALVRLINLYVKGIGTGNEHIACITPPSAKNMDFFQRKTSECWSAWDDARILLSPPQLEDTPNE